MYCAFCLAGGVDGGAGVSSLGGEELSGGALSADSCFSSLEFSMLSLLSILSTLSLKEGVDKLSVSSRVGRGTAITMYKQISSSSLSCL